MAQANFNIRGWQGRWRYTAPTALFFYGRIHPKFPTHRPMKPGPRRLVICFRRRLFAE
jgi:hypothetical protein